MIHSKPETRDGALDALALSERFLLWNFRAWACSCRGQRLPAEPVRLACQNIGIPAAATAIDAAMTHLVLATRRPLAVNCPPHAGLSDDERMLIAAAAAAQSQECCRARELLGQVLPAPGSGPRGRSPDRPRPDPRDGRHPAAVQRTWCRGQALPSRPSRFHRPCTEAAVKHDRDEPFCPLRRPGGSAVVPDRDRPAGRYRPAGTVRRGAWRCDAVRRGRAHPRSRSALPVGGR